MQPHALLWFVCGFRFDLVGILDDSFGIFTLFTGTKAKACSLSSGALWFSRWNCKFESAVSLAEVFTIHFSKSKRCCCVKSLRIISLRSSLGNCFNKPYIFTISRRCLPSIGDSEVCPPSYLPSKPVSFLPHFHAQSELQDSLKFPMLGTPNVKVSSLLPPCRQTPRIRKFRATNCSEEEMMERDHAKLW